MTETDTVPPSFPNRRYYFPLPHRMPHHVDAYQEHEQQEGCRDGLQPTSFGLGSADDQATIDTPHHYRDYDRQPPPTRQPPLYSPKAFSQTKQICNAFSETKQISTANKRDQEELKCADGDSFLGPCNHYSHGKANQDGNGNEPIRADTNRTQDGDEQSEQQQRPQTELIPGRLRFRDVHGLRSIARIPVAQQPPPRSRPSKA